MHPAICFDSPIRGPFNRVGIINNRPVDQPRVVKALVEQHTAAAGAKDTQA
jgi:hypothetical protein